MSEGAVIHLCQGPPRCLLEGDEAVKAQEDGCAWCRRIFIDEDGTETITGPYDDAALKARDNNV